MTIICLAGGPSLSQAQIDACRGQAFVLAINATYRKALWADALYAADFVWWESVQWAPEFEGEKFTIHSYNMTPPPGIVKYANTGLVGLETAPGGLRTGGNSGYQAINLAYHLGATRILLLGYDCQDGPNGETHHHPPHAVPWNHDYEGWKEHFLTLAEPLQAAGVEVINCSARTALTAFPRRPIHDVL